MLTDLLMDLCHRLAFPDCPKALFPLSALIPANADTFKIQMQAAGVTEFEVE
jgi:hypothetical protein